MFRATSMNISQGNKGWSPITSPFPLSLSQSQHFFFTPHNPTPKMYPKLTITLADQRQVLEDIEERVEQMSIANAEMREDLKAIEAMMAAFKADVYKDAIRAHAIKGQAIKAAVMQAQGANKPEPNRQLQMPGKPRRDAHRVSNKTTLYLTTSSAGRCNVMDVMITYLQKCVRTRRYPLDHLASHVITDQSTPTDVTLMGVPDWAWVLIHPEAPPLPICAQLVFLWYIPASLSPRPMADNNVKNDVDPTFDQGEFGNMDDLRQVHVDQRARERHLIAKSGEGDAGHSLRDSTDLIYGCHCHYMV